MQVYLLIQIQRRKTHFMKQLPKTAVMIKVSLPCHKSQLLESFTCMHLNIFFPQPTKIPYFFSTSRTREPSSVIKETQAEKQNVLKQLLAFLIIIIEIMNFLNCESSLRFPTPYIVAFPIEPPNRSLFQSNFIKSSKYNFVTFLPKATLLQYRRFANIYFLLIGILSSVPLFGSLNTKLLWMPIITVLLISLIREAYEDYQKHCSDNNTNHNSIATVWRESRWMPQEWGEVLTGDVLMVKRDETFPADLIFLNSSSPDKKGFIETASLDGQKNLKPKEACMQNSTTFSGKIQCTVPDKDMNAFAAKIKTQEMEISLEGNKQFLYRGAKLKNTEFVIGVAVYTGRNTKVMLNSNQAVTKNSNLERKLNKVLICLLILKMIVCLGIAIGGTINYEQLFRSGYYIDWPKMKKSSFYVGAVNFVTYCLIMSSMIPVSLVVSLDMVKIAQSYFISFDQIMHSSSKIPAEARNSALNEELGQVKYVFSDKTGTLTKNIMVFHTAFIALDSFEFITEGNESTLTCERLVNILSNNEPYHSSSSLLMKCYFSTLVLAHEAFRLQTAPNVFSYQSSSPDQIALLQAAKSVGYQLISSSKNSVEVSILGEAHTFKVYERFGFDSYRKRMSVLVQINEELVLLSKGADNVILERLSAVSRSSYITEHIVQQIKKSSREGLRSLMITMKIVSRDEYYQFKERTASLPLGYQSKQYNRLVDAFQTDLDLIGATAVLDSLQDCVGSTIADLLKANIHFWMLTGDKMETAENIAKNCQLIQNGSKVVHYQNIDDHQAQLNYIEKLIASINHPQTNDIENYAYKYALVISGEQIRKIVDSQELAHAFGRLSIFLSTVICCRMQPIQKAQVVKLVRHHIKAITLSIGDGANDVPMLKAAHIGVGLFGKEGMNAVQASDYAIGQFRMLRRLLFVHGRWNYIRLSEMSLYFLYKSMMFTVPRVVFAIYNAQSGQTIFDDMYIILYNLVFTSLPLVIRALFEQDVNYVVEKTKQTIQIIEETTEVAGQVRQEVTEQVRKEARKKVRKEAREGATTVSTLFTGVMAQLMSEPIKKEEAVLPFGFIIDKEIYASLPLLYCYGQECKLFNWKTCLAWITEGIVTSTAITLIVFSVLSGESINEMGWNPDLWMVSITIYSSIVVTVTLKLALNTRHWTMLLALSIVLTSLVPYVVYLKISSFALSSYVSKTAQEIFKAASTYLIVFFCCMVLLVIDGAVIHFQYWWKAAYIRKKGLSFNLKAKIVDQYARNRKIQEEDYSKQKLSQTQFNSF